MGKPATHPPGSDDALAAGCICPVLDNGHGRGYYGMGGGPDENGEPRYVFTVGCPVHDGQGGGR